jgi:hypothetical protein
MQEIEMQEKAAEEKHLAQKQRIKLQSTVVVTWLFSDGNAPIRVFNGVLTPDFAKEAKTRDQTRVLLSCEMVKEAQCSGGKERLFSFVPNALLISRSSVFISFEFP